MKQDANPISPGPTEAAADFEPKCDRRRGSSRAPRHTRRPQLKLTSMIDVVFLLLVFFVVTASFQIDEGSLQAMLPGNTSSVPPHIDPPPVPTVVSLRSSDDGVTYSMSVDGVPVLGASELSSYMANRVRTGQMASDDLVKIQPQGHVRWQHVLNVYNACVSAELEQVAFAQ